MSSSPKYSEVDVVGEAARSLAQTVEASYRRMVDELESEMQRRRRERLEREQSEIHLTTQRLSGEIQGFASEADADVIREELSQLHDRLSRCSTIRPNDLSSARSRLRELGRIEKALNSSRRRLEALRFNRALDGLARQVALLKAELKDLDSRDCERFDPGTLAMITQSVAVLERDIARKQLNQAEECLTQVRQRLDAHVRCVLAGRDQRDQQRHAAEQDIATVTDRYHALGRDAALTQYLTDDLQKLQPELQVLDKLLTTEQSAGVHHQASRLNERLDRIVAAARSRIEKVEKQKMVTAQLISVVTEARGILLSGCQQGADGPATVRFRVEGRGMLEIQVGLDGPISVRAEGFKHEQRLAPDGTIERSCDGFVKWFEQIRESARKQGLEIGTLRWDGQPKPRQSSAAGVRSSQSSAWHQAQERNVRR